MSIIEGMVALASLAGLVYLASGIFEGNNRSSAKSNATNTLLALESELRLAVESNEGIHPDDLEQMQGGSFTGNIRLIRNLADGGQEVIAQTQSPLFYDLEGELCSSPGSGDCVFQVELGVDGAGSAQFQYRVGVSPGARAANKSLAAVQNVGAPGDLGTPFNASASTDSPGRIAISQSLLVPTGSNCTESQIMRGLRKTASGYQTVCWDKPQLTQNNNTSFCPSGEIAKEINFDANTSSTNITCETINQISCPPPYVLNSVLPTELEGTPPTTPQSQCVFPLESTVAARTDTCPIVSVSGRTYMYLLSAGQCVLTDVLRTIPALVAQ